MKKILLFLIFLIVVNLNFAFSQNTMRIDTLSGHPGDTLTFSLKVNNAQSFVAFQTDIQIPSQLTYVNNSAVLTSRANGHTLAVSLINPALLRVLAYSLTLNPFLGTSGAVMTFKCSVTGYTPGNYNLNLVTPILADWLNVNILTGSSSGLFKLLLQKISFNTGSINFGRTLLGQNVDYNFYIYNNGTDTLTVSKTSSNSSSIKFLDSSGFTLIPGANKMRTVRLYGTSRGIKKDTLIIRSDDPLDTLHKIPAQGEVYTINELYLNNITVKYGAPGIIKLRLKNYETVNAFQLSITMPSSISYVSGSVVLNPLRKDDHVITAAVLTGNVLKIISYSPTNKPFLGNDSTIAEFSIIAKGNPGNYTIPISEGIISDTNGINVMSNVYSGVITLKSPIIGLPATIVFDTISYIDTNRKQLTIQNTGTDTLVISGINATESSFVNETVLPKIIPPGSSLNFTIRFSNPVQGLHTGNLLISSNDSLRNPGSVAVRGYIYRPNRLYVTSPDFNSRDTSYIPFGISNKLPFTAFQFDVTLPSQSVFIPNSAVLTSRANGHQVYTNVLPNGDIRVIAFSMLTNTFSGDSGDVVKFKVAINADTGIYNVSVKNVIISDSNNVNIATGYDNGFIRVNPYPPGLISPLNGSVGNPLNLNLFWHKSPFASYYHLQVALDSLFTNKIINDSTSTDTTRSLVNLIPLTYYYWRVRIKNYSGASQFTNFWKFRTIGTPTQVVLASPANNSVNQPLNITFKWFKAIDQVLALTVSNYWFEYSTDSTFATGVLKDTTLTDTIKLVTGLSNITSYWWRVKAKNEIGWAEYSSAWKLTTIVPVPVAPILISPANGATGVSLTPLIDWNDITYATSYRLQISTDSLFGTTVLDSSGVTVSQVNITAAILNNYTKYYWRVNATNVAGTGLWSAVWNFTTLVPIPGQPVLLLPINGATGVSLTPLMDWNDVTYATSYRLQITDTVGTTVWDTSGLTVSQVTVPTGKLTGLKKYNWRVNATNIAGTGIWSSIWNFTTLQNLSINLKVYLEGFWDGTSQITDTARIYLANSTTPFAFVDSAKVVLSTTGTAIPAFSKASNGSYYIVVIHRNHLETWSKLPQVFTTGTPVNYDFTTAATKAFGDNMKQVGSVWVLYGGDPNQDGEISAMDIPIFIAEFGLTGGYFSCDFNGDGDVNAMDVQIIASNFGLTKAVPTLDYIGNKNRNNNNQNSDKKKNDKQIKNKK